jgi:alkylresorcinol/alkylpyrone synthase/polyketide synthase Type III
MSSIVARKLQLRDTVHRLDVVGMGCNGGMSALHTALMMAQPNRTVLMVCCEINSAIYLQDGTVQCGLVNSLFGDGAAAVVIQGESSKLSPSLRTMTPSVQLIAFESFTMPEYSDAMRFDWNAEQKKWGFFLSREIPWVVGNSIPTPVRRLLDKMQLSQADIQHWVMHSGGGAVMDAAQSSLGLNASDLRHSRSVLRDYGNISSGSFLVSLQRLLMEGTVVSGDLGLLIAMGPGATIEASICRFV